MSKTRLSSKQPQVKTKVNGYLNNARSSGKVSRRQCLGIFGRSVFLMVAGQEGTAQTVSARRSGVEAYISAFTKAAGTEEFDS